MLSRVSVKEKEFDKLSIEQVKTLFSNLYLLQEEIEDFERILKEPPPELVEVVESMPPWSMFYELPYPHFLALFLYCQGLLDVLKSSVELDDPQEYWLTLWGLILSSP